MSKEIVLEVEKKDDVTVVKLIGEIDIFSASDFKDQMYSIFESDRNEKKILDLKELTYIDSTGLGVFVAILKKANLKKSDLKIINMNSTIFKLFSITGLDRLFQIERGNENG